MSEGVGTHSKSKQSLKKRPHLRTAVDAESVQAQWLLLQFKSLQDPRGRQGVEHHFLSIIPIAILATIGGATVWEDIDRHL